MFKNVNQQLNTAYLGVCAALVCALFLLLGIVVAFMSPPISAFARTDCGTWQEVPHPFGNTSLSILAISSTEAYALGNTWNDPPTPNVITVGRWDGSTWSVLSTFTVTHDYNYLETPVDIVAFAQDNIWLVGTTHSGPFTSSWARHWDGATWMKSSLPSRGFFTVGALSASSPTDMWVVGYDYAGPYSNVRVDHWNGVQWNIVAKKIFTDSMSLIDIKALGPKNIWIVGSQNKGSSYGTLTIHRGQSGWEIIPSPNPKPLDHASLRNLSAISPKNIWAVGDQGVWPNYSSFIERWNGKKWKLMPQPASAYVSNTVAISSTSVWANTNLGVAYWDGSSWHITDAIGINVNAALANGDAWATGFDQVNQATQIFHYTGGLPPCYLP